MEGDKSIGRARALAARQEGLIAWQQLSGLGIPTRTAAGWIAREVLIRVLPRVYSIDHREPTPRRDLMAAVLFAGPGAMLSHATAAWWCGLIIHRTSDLIEVSSPRHVRSKGRVIVHGRRHLPRTLHRGVPVTLPAQIVLDLAATQERPLVRRALAVLDYRKQLDLDALERIAGPGIAGTARLRQALMIHQPLLAFTNGPLEDDFLAWCERWGVPLPRINAHVHGVLVDAYWPEYELVVELDGDANHSSRGQRRLDKRKELVLRHHGLTVVRYDWELVHHEPDRVHADLVGQMQRGRQAR